MTSWGANGTANIVWANFHGTSAFQAGGADVALP